MAKYSDPVPGKGVLYQNRNKTNPKAPDMYGRITGLDGVVYNISAWINEPTNGNGKKFFSLNMSPLTEEQKERVFMRQESETDREI